MTMSHMGVATNQVPDDKGWVGLGGLGLGRGRVKERLVETTPHLPRKRNTAECTGRYFTIIKY